MCKKPNNRRFEDHRRWANAATVYVKKNGGLEMMIYQRISASSIAKSIVRTIR